MKKNKNYFRKGLLTFLVGVFTLLKVNAQCTLTIGNTTSDYASGTASSLTISHTVSGSNPLLVVRISTIQSNPTSVKYNGLNLTLLASKNISYQYVSIWYLIAPPAGTYNLVVNGAVGFAPIVGVTTFTGAHQTAPFGTPVGAVFNSANPSVTVSSATGQQVIDVLSINFVPAPGAGQTQQYVKTFNGFTGIGSSKAGTSSVTMSWSSSYPTGAILAVAVKPCVNASPLVASAGPDKANCGGASVTIGGSPTASGGVAPYTYTWAPVTGLSSSTIANPTATPAATTSYVVTVTDAAGTSKKDTVVVTVGTTPAASAGTSKTICSGTPVTIGGSPTASGGTPPYSYAWAPATGLSSATIANPVATPLITTTYTVTVTDSKGCSKTASTTISVCPAPKANAGSDKALCQPSSACVTLGGSPTASGGTAPFTYLWIPSTGLSSATIANPLATSLSTTTYIVKVTDSKGCTATDTVKVTVTPCCPPGAIAVSLQAYLNKIISKAPITPGKCISLAPPTNKAAWCSFVGDPVCDPTPIDESHQTQCVITPNGSLNTCTTRWTSSHTNHNGNKYECTIKLSHTVVSLTSGIAYLHDIAPHPVKNLQQGNLYAYVIKAKLADSSDVSLEGESTCKVIIAPCTKCDTLKAGFIATIGCKGTPTIFTNTTKGMIAGVTYSWDFGDGGVSTAVNPSHTYATAGSFVVKLTVDNCNGCMSVATHTVVIPNCGGTCPNNNVALLIQEYLNIIVSHATVAASSCVSLNPPSDRGALCKFIGDAACDPYPLYWANTTSCQTTTAGSVTTYTSVWTTSYTNHNGSHYECAIQIGHTSANLNAGVSYYHDIAPDPIKNVQLGNIHAFTIIARLTNGTDVTMYGEASCKDVSCCNSTGVSAGPDQKICKGESAQLQAAGGSTYNWAPATGLSSTTIANPVARPTVTTTYTVTITKAGCSQVFTDDVRVEVFGPGANAGNDVTICSGQSTVLNATGGTSYQWNPAEGLSNPYIANPVAKPAVTTIYTVKVLGGNACPYKDTDKVTVKVNDGPVVVTGGDVISCDNTGVPISASGGISYSWAPAGSLSNAFIANPIANPLQTTTYTVTVTDAWGCVGKATVTVYKGNSDLVGVSPNQVICLNDFVLLNAFGGTSYSWSPATGLSCTDCPNPFASPHVTTTYSVKITDLKGCVATKQVTVTVDPALNVNAGSDITLCPGQTAQLHATGGGTDFSWSPSNGLSCVDCADPFVNINQTTTYKVTLRNNNCVGEDEVVVSSDSLFNAYFTDNLNECTQLVFKAFPKNKDKYEWTFGDGTASVGDNVTHTYATAGTYYVCLSISGTCGSFSICRLITIKDSDCNCNKTTGL